MPWAAVGGTEHATLRVARATEGAGFGHVMFCRRDAPEVRDFFAAEGFETESYDPVEPSYRRATKYARDSYRLAREFRRRRVHLVHCADVAAAFTAGLAGLMAGVVARVSPQKDFPTLARAAALVSAERRDVRFMVVGDYEEANREHYDEVRRSLADAGVESRFVFTGFRTDVARLMSAFDVFVLCTHFEGLPLVILEAMARGRPVVATAVDGIPEIVLDGKTGLLHPHEDAGALAARLLSLLGDEAYAARLGGAGREFVKMEWSRERFAENMAAAYRDALRLGGRGGAGVAAVAARGGAS
ncbi:MAG: glycosyltransferase [Acidobacteria bacterium]|nr:glycosyltransferase [Acidobacteriota bacterium]